METRDINKYIRVTEILYPFSGLQNIDAEILAHAAERGTKVHKICEGIVAGLGEIGVDDETWGYVESFKKWWDKGVDIIKMEERFWDDELELTGQVDLIINTPEGLAIVDLKTSSRPSKTWEAQGSAYAYLAKRSGYDIKKIYFLHLNKHGKDPKLIEYPIDDSFFLAVFRTYKHFYHKGKNMNNLTEKMQERLDKWRKNTIPVASAEKVKAPPPSRRGGKGDFGDALTLEEWEKEAKKSQTRR